MPSMNRVLALRFWVLALLVRHQVSWQLFPPHGFGLAPEWTGSNFAYSPLADCMLMRRAKGTTGPAKGKGAWKDRLHVAPHAGPALARLLVPTEDE
jgi:hypothetical protein